MIGTIQDLKDWLGEEGDKQDGRLTFALQRGSALANAYCRRKSFESVTYTDELYDGTASDTLQLDNWPLTAVATVKEKGVALVVGTDPSANPSPEVLWYAEEGHLVRPFGYWWPYRRYYSATYTAGYSAQNMPPIILEAALNYAALILREKDRVGFNTKTIGQQSTTFTRELPKAVRDGLDFYRDLAICRRVA